MLSSIPPKIQQLKTSNPATTAIMTLCVSFFALSFLFPHLKMNMGLAPAYWTSAPWTIATSLFMHASLIHLLFNMFALYSVRNLEEQVGSLKFAGYYLLAGLGGSAFVILFGQLNTIHMGASGAILGLFGFYLCAWWETARYNQSLLLTLGLCLIISFSGGVSWEAHAGGILVGLILGSFYRKNQLK